jgi:hypothetical protein
MSGQKQSERLIRSPQAIILGFTNYKAILIDVNPIYIPTILLQGAANLFYILETRMWPNEEIWVHKNPARDMLGQMQWA